VWFAVMVDFEENSALSGVMWYNNDGATVFPTVLAGTGHSSGPGLIEEMVVVAENVSGVTSGWSEVAFSEPIAATQGGLYVVFVYPEGTAFQFEGLHGGPAIGFCSDNSGSIGWVSGDGESWQPLHKNARFAVEPNLVAVQDGMLLKSFSEDLGPEDESFEYHLSMGPNPFNPSTTIMFGTKHVGQVRLDIFDIRGRRVVNLLNEELPAGNHQVAWTGTDGTGREVASGVYFTRLVVDNECITKRMLLVK